MIRILALLAVVGAIAFGAAWLVDRPGAITVVWQGWEIETTVPVAALALVVITTLLLLLFGLLKTLINIPESVSHFFQGRRRRRGFNAVAHGLMAIGVGDGRGARRAATEARRLIGDEPLTLLLRAQAAQLSGDREEANDAFRAMLEQPETRPLGYRGLFVEARRRGDDTAALEIADLAVRANPDVPWAGPALLDLQSGSRNWDAALSTIERNQSSKITDRDATRRQRAVLLTAKARDLATSNPSEARALAGEAAKLAPTLVPAAVLAAELFAREGDYRKGAGLLERSWKRFPHPETARAYISLRAGDAPADRLKRATRLVEQGGGSAEAAMAFAEAALAAGEPARARKVLAPLVESGPTRRVCLLMADVENAEYGADGRARAWLARAVVAAPDPAWMSDGRVWDQWEPVSPATGELDSFEWRVPQETLASPASRLLDAQVMATEAPDEAVQPMVPEQEKDIPLASGESVSEPLDTTGTVEQTTADLPFEEPSPPPAERPVPVSLATPKPTPAKPMEFVLPPSPSPDDPGPDGEEGALTPEPRDLQRV